MYTYISNFDSIDDLLHDLDKTDVIGLDTETTSLDYITATPLLLQVLINDKIYILDLRKIDKKHITWLLSKITTSDKTVIGHNIKYDIQILFNNYGVLLTKVYDTMLSEVLIHQGLGYPLISLAKVILTHTGREISKEERKEFYDNPDVMITEDLLIYSAIDVKYLKEIREKQLNLLEESKQLKVLDLECKLIPVTAMMEYEGVLIDAKKWEDINAGVVKTRIVAENDLLNTIIENIPFDTFNNALAVAIEYNFNPGAKYKADVLESIVDVDEIKNFVRYGTWVETKYGKNKGSLSLLEGLNIASNDQILQILNKVYGLNLPNTNEDTLNSIPDKPEIINKILLYREYARKSSAYGEGLLEKIHPKTGKIHAKFNQLGTATGRYSSDSPNLQNIPRPTYDADGSSINYRQCFIAGEGYKVITVDYSQQEYRLIGAITGEQKIIDAYKAGKDLHTLTGSIVNNIKLEDVTKKQRTAAKPVNFGVFYGSTAYGLSRKLNLPLEEAERIYNALMGGIKTFRRFREIIQDKIVDRGYSTTLLGRRRYFAKKTLFPGGNSERYVYINRIKREGFNHIIQGTGADITKLAMVDIFYNNPFGGYLKIIMAEHDEIVSLVKEEVAEDALEFIKQRMMAVEQPFLGDIPAAVDGVISDCWEKS